MVSWKKYLIKVLLHKLFHLLFTKIFNQQSKRFLHSIIRLYELPF